MRACSGRGNREKWAFRFFTWSGSGRRLLSSPLIFYAGGVAAARFFYKSSRGGPLSFSPTFAPKMLSPPNFSAAAFSIPSRKRPSSPAVTAGDDTWYPCNTTRAALEARVKGGLLCPITDEGSLEWIVPPVGDREPNPPPNYVVCFLSFLERGFGTPAGRLIRAILHYYREDLHNLNPNSVMQAAVFATVCEGFLGVPAHWNLWLHLFKADMSAHNEGGERRPLRAGSCTLQLRQSRSHQYIWSSMPTSNRGWQNG